MTAAPTNPRQRPLHLSTLVEVLGVAATVRLLEARGGTRLRIAKDPVKSQTLPGILDADQVAALCAAWGGQRPILPMPDKGPDDAA